MPMITDEEYQEYQKWKETQKPEMSKEPAQEEFSTGPSSRVNLLLLLILSLVLLWLNWPVVTGEINLQPAPVYHSHIHFSLHQ